MAYIAYMPYMSQVTGGNDTVHTYYIYDSDIDKGFKKETSTILANTDWRKTYNIKEVDDEKDAMIKIKLKPDAEVGYDDMVEYYDYANIEDTPYNRTQLENGVKKKIKFSVTYMGKKPLVHINADNWLNGVAESNLSLQNYRKYVINHEFGHALGLDHDECKTGKCSVMYQATRGCPKGTHCGWGESL